jgi:hypothetical protein
MGKCVIRHGIGAWESRSMSARKVGGPLDYEQVSSDSLQWLARPHIGLAFFSAAVGYIGICRRR